MTEELVVKMCSRKFLLAVLAFLVFTGLLIANLLDIATYQVLTMFALGGYLGANVIQKATVKS